MLKSVLDTEIKSLVLYSVTLTIFSGLIFFTSSFQKPYMRDYWIIFGSFVALIAGVFGCVQGCKRMKELVLAQQITLALTIAIYVISIFDEFILSVKLLFFNWGYDSGVAIVSLWAIFIIIVFIMFLVLGIIFAQRVRMSMSGKIHGLKTALL